MTPVPAVSVVVPTYNRSRSLTRLLTSMSALECPAGGFETIVVDDGSSDDTGAVAAAFGDRVRYLRQQNKGPAAARNAGWRAASAPLIAFTDDDTVPDPRWLVHLLEPFADPAVGGVGGSILGMTNSLLSDLVQLERQVDHGVDDHGTVRYLVTANAAFRRDVLENVGGFDETFPNAAGEDVDLSFRVRQCGVALRLAPRATVLHDHRTTVRAFYRTYFRHGQAHALLLDLHRMEMSRTARRRVIRLRYWLDRHRYYRITGRTSPARAWLYVLMRMVGLLFYAAGMVSARRRR